MFQTVKNKVEINVIFHQILKNVQIDVEIVNILIVLKHNVSNNVHQLNICLLQNKLVNVY